MSTYAIGDVQGCYDALQRLLDKIQFDQSQDRLWFTGDLINRGPNSLKTLRLIHSLKNNSTIVLGNHDLGSLAIARGLEPYNSEQHTFSDILEAPDKETLLLFLESLPLIHVDAQLGYTLVHAGIHPAWDLKLALTLANEVESVLRSEARDTFYAHLYGNTPDAWDPKLSSFDRLRFIANCFTRMRFCTPEGRLDLITKEKAQNAPEGYLPWFKIPNRKTKDIKIIFGHWAALNGVTQEPNVFALDTGCVWGGCLTAMRLEDQQKFQINC